VFFYRLPTNHEIDIELEPGKTLIISISGVTKPDQNEIRHIFFQLNAYPRTMEILDEALAAPRKNPTKAAARKRAAKSKPSWSVRANWSKRVIS
jgi:pyruvate carboxylase